MSEWNRGFTNKPEKGNLCISPEENGENGIKVGIPRDDGEDPSTVVLYKEKLGSNKNGYTPYQPIKE